MTSRANAKAGSAQDLSAGHGDGAGQPQPNDRRKSQLQDWTVPGFCWNTRVTTRFGALPVQALRPNDPLMTASGACLPLSFVTEIRLDEDYLARCPDAMPVLIRKGALSPEVPLADLVLSPHQQINLSRDLAQPVLRKARDLVDDKKVLRQPMSDVSYFTFHCGIPALLVIDGLEVPVRP